MREIMTLNSINTKEDILLQTAIQQGYVPPKCNLAGGLVMALVNDGENPCAKCNADRNKCEGRSNENPNLLK